MPGSQNITSPSNSKSFWHLLIASIILIGCGYSFVLFQVKSRDFIKAYHFSQLPEIILPYTYDLSDNDHSNPHKYQGWSESENWGTWSKESNAILAFRLNESSIGKDLRLSFQFHHFYVNEQNKKIRTDIHINGSLVDTWIFEQRAGLTKEIDIHFNSPDNALEIEFQIDGILSPAEAFNAPDKRKLGIGLSKLFIQEIDTKL